MNKREIINLITKRLDRLRRILITEGDRVTDDGDENIITRIRELNYLRHRILNPDSYDADYT